MPPAAAACVLTLPLAPLPPLPAPPPPPPLDSQLLFALPDPVPPEYKKPVPPVPPATPGLVVEQAMAAMAPMVLLTHKPLLQAALEAAPLIPVEQAEPAGVPAVLQIQIKPVTPELHPEVPEEGEIPVLVPEMGPIIMVVRVLRVR